MRHPIILFIVLAFFMSAASVPSAHALGGEACGSSNPPCPSGYQCKILVGTSGFCELATPAPAQAAPASEAQPITDYSVYESGGGTGDGLFRFYEPGGGKTDNTTLINPLKGGGNVESFLNSILEIVIRIGAIIVILMLVYVGYLFVIAEGEPGKISEARQMLLWTVVGALILLGSQAIAIGIKATVQALSTG